MLIRELMALDPICCSPETDVARVAKLMTDNECGAIAICDGTRVVGIVTDRDIVTRGVATGADPKTLPVADVMTRNLILVHDDDRVERAVHLMESRHIRRLPVIDEEEQIVGMISMTDMAEHLAERQAGELLREVSALPRRIRHSH